MKKVKDLTQNAFNLLKHDRLQWPGLWQVLVYKKSPTLFSKYMAGNGLNWADITSFYSALSRPEFDRLQLLWQDYSEWVKAFFYSISGNIYKNSISDFGIFLSVGIRKKTFTFFETKKGIVMFIDIWYLWGIQNEKELGKVFQVDEITALFTDNYKRIRPRTQ